MIGVIILTITAFILSIILIIVDKNAKEEKYLKYLPNLNCGACGYGSCKGMSKEIEKNFECYKKCKPLKGKKLEEFIEECEKDA